MDKTAFIKRVRRWDAVQVKAALADDNSLAAYVDRIGKTPLHHCAGINAGDAKLSTKDSIKTARALVEAGADVNAVRVIIDEGEEFHALPLWYAVAWGRNFELTRFLLERGAEPVGCMWAACWAQDEETARLLRSFGADVDPAFHHETPLLQIVKAKRLRLLPWLVANGANINFQDEQGYSALHYAVKRNHNLEQIEQLLSLGANPRLTARDGTTPLSLAKRRGKSKVVSLFQHSEVIS
jgi:ankyrin repeat protein